jgi:hypothetical protein
MEKADACKPDQQSSTEKQLPSEYGMERITESMRHSSIRGINPMRFALAVSVSAVVVFTCAVAAAQNPQMADKLMAIKSAQDANKQKLATYTWQQTETISVKGSVKDTKVYQVQIGPDGKPQKTEVNDQAAQPSGRQGRLKQKVVAHAKEEYQEYGQSIAALAQQYTTPDPDRLMQAKQQGNISLQPGNGTVSLIIKNYVKPGDQVTLTVNDQTKQPVSLQVSSYLNDPKDAVTIAAQFAQLPDGTNHVASTQVNGVSKQLTVVDQNANYQKL